MAGRLPDAEGYYKRLYDKDSTNIVTLLNIANINARRGSNNKAISFYKRALNIDSSSFNVYRQLASLSKTTGDIGANLAYLQKANTINPENGNVAYDLSGALILFQQNAQAEKVLDRALLADTANILLLNGKAQVCYALKKYLETITVCQKIIAKDAKTSQIVNFKGISEFNLHKYSDCIKTFQALDSSQTQTESSYYYLGMSHKALKADAKAIYYLQKAIEEAISPNTNTYYSEIADCYDRIHLPKKALTSYQRGLTFGELPMVYYSMASIYDSNLKDTTNAVKYYKKYLAAKKNAEKQKNYIDFTEKRIVDLTR